MYILFTVQVSWVRVCVYMMPLPFATDAKALPVQLFVLF